MKKRVKLLTTIASLCLAVALMAFGVYAASSSELTVASTVTFEAQVEVTWDWKVETKTAAGTETVAEGSQSFGAGVTSADWNAGDEGPETGDPLPTEVPFPLENGAQIIYTFTCTNNANANGDAATISTTGTQLTNDDLTNCTVVYSENWATGATATANGGTAIFTITFTLTSASATVECDGFNHTLKAE